MQYTFVIFCDDGKFGVQALLQAASLKRFLRCDYELVAFGPSGIGEPKYSVRDELVELGVRLEQAVHVAGLTQPVACKLDVLQQVKAAGKLIILDKDLLCTSAFTHEQRFECPLNLRPVSKPSFNLEENIWSELCSHMGLSVPTGRVVATVSRQLSYPEFDAGLLAVHGAVASTLADAWAAVLHILARNSRVRQWLPSLESFALALAIHKAGIATDCLDDRYNYPVSLKPLTPGKPPIFCSYHSPHIIRSEPWLTQLVQSIAEEHPTLKAVLSNDSEWSGLMLPYARHQFSTGEVVPKEAVGLIGGIPRSGTSYLCSLLNRTGSSVAINEPPEVIMPLVTQVIPWGTALYHREVRRKILDGEPIVNKLNDGLPVEDTSTHNKRELYVPKIEADRFLLFTKQTSPYLVRVKQLKRAIPTAFIIACIRNPYDTIASWKASFEHLEKADVERFMVCNPNDPWLDAIARHHLLQIVKSEDNAIKRALFWRFLSERILEYRDDLLVLRYEDLVTDPNRVMKKIFKVADWPVGVMPRFAFESSQVRSKRELLTQKDCDAIGGLCMDIAVEFGYDYPNNNCTGYDKKSVIQSM